MAHTNQTPNYGLSEFVGTDKPAWLVDYNGDMEKIDLGMKAAQDVADAAKDEADQGALDIAAVTVTANAANAKATGALSNIADTYDATATYGVGNVVIYNNISYKCIVDITIPEEFDASHWQRITIEQLLDIINVNVSTKAPKLYTYLGYVDINQSIAIPSDVTEVVLEFEGNKNGVLFNCSSSLTGDIINRANNFLNYTGSASLQATCSIVNRVLTFTGFKIDGQDADSYALHIYYK